MKRHSLIEHLAVHFWMFVGVVLLALDKHAAAYAAFSYPMVQMLVIFAVFRRIRPWIDHLKSRMTPVVQHQDPQGLRIP